jgi:hypothetical protein
MPDIARDPAILKRKKLRHALYAAVGVLIVVAVSIALARMEPAAPTVDQATVLTDTVKRGSIIRQHRGLGTLVRRTRAGCPREPTAVSNGFFCGPARKWVRTRSSSS